MKWPAVLYIFTYVHTYVCVYKRNLPVLKCWNLQYHVVSYEYCVRGNLSVQKKRRELMQKPFIEVLNLQNSHYLCMCLCNLTIVKLTTHRSHTIS